uniref:Uncharacterized protein n=1 Tax=Engystomops pustulosus TaxID=76066 RepID=A0AAV6YVY6_ENGPU|nr:hypothetical protein GDO81_028931 [Engystomops pustulosus]
MLDHKFPGTRPLPPPPYLNVNARKYMGMAWVLVLPLVVTMQIGARCAALSWSYDAQHQETHRGLETWPYTEVVPQEQVPLFTIMLPCSLPTGPTNSLTYPLTSQNGSIC